MSAINVDRFEDAAGTSHRTSLSHDEVDIVDVGRDLGGCGSCCLDCTCDSDFECDCRGKVNKPVEEVGKESSGCTYMDSGRR